MNPLHVLLLAALSNPGVVTLDDAVSAAAKNQPTLRAAHAATGAADARADQARAPLLPQVVASASYERGTANGSRQAGAGAATAPFSAQTYGNFSFGVTASQLVYDFGQTSNQYRAVRQGAEAQASTEAAARNAAIAAARSAFFQARAQRELSDVAHGALENEERHLQQVQAFVDAKARPPIDLYQARQDVANARFAVASAEGNYEAAKATLNQAMGVEGDIRYDVAGDALGPVAGEDGAVERLVDEALRTRPELAAIQKQLDAQAAVEQAAKGSYGPSISVSTTFSASGPTLDALAPNWNAMANVTWPLFTGLSTPARVREAQANIQGLLAGRDQLRQGVRADLERAVAAVRGAKAGVAAAADALVNAHERLRLAEERYKAGVGNVIELGDAQTADTAAAAQRVQADFALSSARALLLQALGRAR